MSHTVFCRKYQKELPGLPAPPFPGEKGQEVYETVSQQAWMEWLQHQTRLINEKQLNLASAEDRQYLEQQMQRFLDNQEHDVAEGYVPPES